MKRTILIAFALASFTLHAEDLHLLNGTIVKGDITRAEPDGLVVETVDGIQKVPFDFLPAELQKRFGYSADKAAQFRSDQMTAHAQAAQRATVEAQVESSSIRIRGRVERASEACVIMTAEEGRTGAVTHAVQRGSALGGYIGHQEVVEETWSKLPHAIVVYGLQLGSGESWEGTVWKAGEITSDDVTYNEYATTKTEAVRRVLAAMAPPAGTPGVLAALPPAPEIPPIPEAAPSSTESSAAIPTEVLAQIKADAEKLFPGDFKMQLFEIDEQSKAWLKLHGQ